MSITAEEAEIIALAVARALQQARSVSDSEHYDHHRWISAKIKSEERRAEFWRQMLVHTSRWGAVSIVSAVVYALWLGARQIILIKTGVG